MAMQKLRYQLAGRVELQFPEYEEWLEDEGYEDRDWYREEYEELRSDAVWDYLQHQEPVLFHATFYSVERV
jgi:hypothetical protein